MAEPSILEPENPRYTSDLLLVHGLWTGPWLWRAAAGGFAHRGWRCLVFDGRPSLAGGDRRLDNFTGWRDAVVEVARRSGTPPVVLGHDAGGLIALSLANLGAVRAAIAVAPLLDGTAHLLTRWQRAAAWVRRQGVEPPPADHPWLANESVLVRKTVQVNLSRETAGRIRLGRDTTSPDAPRVPALLVAPEADPTVSRIAIEVTARGLDADFRSFPGGHWPMLGGEINQWMTLLHRWIVQRADSSLLLLRGDEDLRDE